MALSVYLDDCSNSDLLAKLLQKAGHQIARPTDPAVGLTRADDDLHFAYALANNLTIITKNPADFLAFHESVRPNHPGILGVYQDNDAARDMSDAEIMRAIGNIEASAQSGGQPIAGCFHVVNDWRY